MKFDKKTIQKEDGRILIYYHFSDTATASQSGAFETVRAVNEKMDSDQTLVAKVPSNENIATGGGGSNV